MMDKDRITRAWELRRDIHGWLKSHIASAMEDIFAAFPQVSPHTLRQCVKRLRRDGVVAMRGRRGERSFYSAVGEIATVASVRARQAESGRRNIVHAQAANRAAKKSRGTVYLAGHTPPAPGSRGQGCARQRVFVNCSHLY